MAAVIPPLFVSTRSATAAFSGNGTNNEYSALACHESFTDRGSNLQWPANRNSGSADTPCVEGITFANPMLGELTDHGGFLLPRTGR
ncbi:MAG: hypothetical protein JW751_13495 [Polyangiaceae bacterium]|nr:hypothetical protein [Polyangiaceae bacterium]